MLCALMLLWMERYAMPGLPRIAGKIEVEILTGSAGRAMAMPSDQ